MKFSWFMVTACPILVVGLAACGGGSGGRASVVVVPPTIPASPAVFSRQIDRMGRAGVNTALVSPLKAAGPRGVDRDAYNVAARTSWGTFRDNIRSSLAVYDGLDTVCGNQILANVANTTPARYDALANALTDDRIYLNSASRRCSQYLAVELNATGLLANTDCGGRTPNYDTIDVTYTALTNNLTVPVGDGVASDTFLHDENVFPFLAVHVPQPAVPAIAARQVDRMGRAGVNTALVSPLKTAVPRGVDRDAYNVAPRASWGSFQENIRASLAVYDGLDTTCGNQILANTAVTTPARYDGLANALTDDRIYLNSRTGTCTQYLGVELNATGLVTNNDCGGRTPNYDSIDVTYTALASTLAAPLGDNVNSDNVVHSTSVFPFLANPLP